VSHKYVSRSHGHYGYAIPSLTDHWSLAFSWDIYSSSYSNKRLAFALGTGIEYNIFPYQESTRRQLRLEYQLHYTYVDYEEKTIFYKYSEHTFREILSATLEIVQPWGKSNVTVSAANYLHDFDLYRLWISGSISLNILEGLSLDLSGNASRVKDQLSLRLSEYAQEDILLRSKEIATSYRYWLSFGFTYSFGSIYTPIVNPRFGY
jgi:hypothetical protein